MFALRPSVARSSRPTILKNKKCSRKFVLTTNAKGKSESKVARAAALASVVGTANTHAFAEHAFASTSSSSSSFMSDTTAVVGDLAGIDGRIAIFFVFAPVLGWVAYNILGPGLNQLENMQKKNSTKKSRGIVGAIGAGAAASAMMMMPEQADAAEAAIGNLAGIDGRIAIFFVFAPVLAWVAYNILGPGLNQLEDMNKKNAKKKRAVITGMGAGLSAASMMALPEQADAAEAVIGNMAGIDGRIAIFFVFAPVLAWVAYNILGPGLNQLEDMNKKNAKKRK